MNAQRLSTLTDRQKEVLRLVAAGFETKEIARHLELSPSAVTERLRAARASLGVSSSRAAARLLLSSEAEAAYKRHVDMSPRLVGLHPSAPTGAASGGADHVVLREDQATFHVPDPLERPGWPLPFATAQKPRNDLNFGQVMVLVTVLTVLLIVGVVGAGSILETLTQVYRGL